MRPNASCTLPAKAPAQLKSSTGHSPGHFSSPATGRKRDRPAGHADASLGPPVLLHGPLRVRPVQETVETAIVGAAHPVGGDGEEGKPVTGIGGSAGDRNELVHDPG